MSSYECIQGSLKRLDTTYNPNTTKGPEPIIEGKYKVTGETRVIYKNRALRRKNPMGTQQINLSRHRITQYLQGSNVHDNQKFVEKFRSILNKKICQERPGLKLKESK